MIEDKKLINLWVNGPLHFYKELEQDTDVLSSPIYKTILLIAKEIRTGKDKDRLLREIQSVSLANCSSVTLFFFYLHWFAFDAIYNRFEEASIILSKMKSFEVEINSPYLKAECYLREAGLEQGEKADRLFLKGLSLLKENTGQYISNVMTLADEFSKKGKLQEFDQKYVKAIPPSMFKLFSYINAIEIGQIEMASKLGDDIQNLKSNIPVSLRNKLEDSARLYDLYLERVDSLEVSNLPLWLHSTKALLDGDTESAIENARRYQMDGPLDDTFTGFVLLRAELGNRNLLAAKRILYEYHSNESECIFLDFFRARVELLENNPQNALRYFKKYLNNCHKYEAVGRLDLELDLAVELKSKQVRFLMDSVYKVPIGDSSKNYTEGSIIKTKIPDLIKDNELEIGADRLHGNSLAIRSVKENLLKFSKLDIPILILGETGVGKDLIARAIHEESNRKKEPFIAINCSAVAESLLQSELFGHEAGAYTGASVAHKGILEEAGKGTVFLDEIGDISKGMQAALLRVLESSEYRPVGSAKPKKLKCRIITATNALLENLVDKGLFRMDLLFRLRRMVLKVPPIRERPLDIKNLSNDFLNSNKASDEKASFDKDLEEAFQNYSWPGNVRELKNEIEKMRLLNSDKKYYTLEDAPFLSDDKILSNSFDTKPLVDKELDRVPNSRAEIIHLDDPLEKSEVFEKNVLKNSGTYFRRIQAIKELFIKHKQMTRKEICQIIGASNLTIGKDIKKLLEEGYINKIEPTKSPRTHYFEIK